MPIYKVISDLNSGKNPVGSEIELTEEAAAAIPWAVKAIEAGAAPEKTKLPSVKDSVSQVLAIEDPIDREIAATDLLQAEVEREDPPTRTTLVSQLEEIIVQAQEDGGEGE